MEPNEIKQELTRIGEEVKAEGLKLKEEFQASVKDKASTAELEAIKTKMLEYTDAQEERFEQLKGIAEKQGMKLQELSEKGTSVPKTFNQAVQEAVAEQAETNKAMHAAKTNTGQRGGMVIKAAALFTRANVLPGVSTAIPYSLVGGGGEIIGIARREPFIREILNAKPTNSAYEWWVEQVSVDGGATTVAEAAAKPLADFDMQERTAPVEKVAVFAKASKEILADMQRFQNFLEEELLELVELEMDAQLYSGNGTSPNLKGLYTWATTMSVASTPFATAGVGVDMANNFDVLLAARAIMQNNSFYTANVALVNPMDFGIMQLLKEPTTGQYIMPPFSTASSMTVAGLRIIANPMVTAGTFVVMDSSKPRLRIREELTLDYGWENDDFRKNLISVVAEERALLYLPTNYAGAVIKGTFATVKAAMETA